MLKQLARLLGWKGENLVGKAITESPWLLPISIIFLFLLLPDCSSLSLPVCLNLFSPCSVGVMSGAHQALQMIYATDTLPLTDSRITARRWQCQLTDRVWMLWGVERWELSFREWVWCMPRLEFACVVRVLKLVQKIGAKLGRRPVISFTADSQYWLGFLISVIRFENSGGDVTLLDGSVCKIACCCPHYFLRFYFMFCVSCLVFLCHTFLERFWS